ncbi:hypothetical protein ACFV7Q_30445 [Streptomyces sp. NPDC059851]|uniref:hypothetical protein n=1 Tax=Streptomyces sp. NPDC059851 TaxID=3346971 RepID=UPI0036617409
MATHTVNGDSRISFWLRVREYAVPPSMIETATARRLAGDWAGACAAAGVDVDLPLRAVARARGQELVSLIRADLRRLAPDLLRWHMPRIAPDGLLRPGLTVPLARYGADGRDGGHRPLFLVVRTPPAWADAGQRMSLALWDGSGSAFDSGAGRHPHPRPSRRFRLDLHRHLWDARRTSELRVRSGADRPPPDSSTAARSAPAPVPPGTVPAGRRCAVDRWAAEARILLDDEGRAGGVVAVRLGGGQRLLLEVDPDPGPGTDAARAAGARAVEAGPPALRVSAAVPDGGAPALPVLPDAATWTLPDLELLRAGAITADRLHPLVAPALVPGSASAAASGPSPTTVHPAGQPRLVECRGVQHRIGLVDGVLAPMDHDPAEIRREELLVALGGPPLPCLRVIDEAHRRPDCLTGVRERLDHGDTAGALAVVEALLGPDAVLRSGPLRDALEAAARQRITYGLYRAGLAGPGPDRLRPGPSRPRNHRPRPRHASA